MAGLSFGGIRGRVDRVNCGGAPRTRRFPRLRATHFSSSAALGGQSSEYSYQYPPTTVQESGAKCAPANNGGAVAGFSWFHFEAYDDRNAEDEFVAHIRKLCIPETASLKDVRRFCHDVRTDDVFFEEIVWNGCDSSALYASFRTLTSPHRAQVVITPDVCLTRVERSCLDLEPLWEEVADGLGPSTSAGVLVRVLEQLSQEFLDACKEMDIDLSSLEESLLSAKASSDPSFARRGFGMSERRLFATLNGFRYRSIQKRRIMLPHLQLLTMLEQKIAASASEMPEVPENHNLQKARLILSQFSPSDQRRLNILHMSTNAALDSLKGVRDRSAIIHQEVSANLAQRTNRVLTILTFMTGVLLPMQMAIYLVEGINVGWLHWPDL